MRNLNLIKFIYILIMDKKNNDFMTINNLKQLIEIFNKFIIDTHGINIESENIDLKKIMFPIMQKIIKTKYGNQLNVRELNKITLKTTRDNIYETHKELFTNEKKFGTIHREKQIHNNRKTHENIDFKESNRPQLKREIANDINNNFNELQNQRNNNTNNKPSQVEFEEKMKDTELTLEDMDLKMKELEDARNKQNTDIITNMKNNNELVTNDNLATPQQINNTNMEPINFNRIPEENERNNLLDNMNNHINDNLNNNVNNDNLNNNTLDGFNLDDNFNDFSLDLTNNTNNNQNYVIDNNQNVINLQDQMIQPQEQSQEHQQQLQQQQQEQLQQQQQEQPQEQPQEQMIHQTILKKIIICSKDRDMEEFPLPNKYKITLEQPMRYIKRIKLVNILINFKKERKKKNTDKSEDEIENFNYAILNLNNYDVNKSNNSKINNSFAFIYPNKVYDEEIFFENELDVLEEINIELLNHNGDLLKIKDNHIIELQLEVF